MKFQSSNPSVPTSVFHLCLGGACRRGGLACRLAVATVLSLVVAQFQGCPGPKPMNDPVATPTPTPTPTPVAAATASPEPTPDVPRYSGAQQMDYIRTAQNDFMTARGQKTEPFGLAKDAFNEAGGASAKGLISREAIAGRRALIGAISKANDDYKSFLTTQDETYRQALVKTPLMQSDVDSLVGEFTKASKTESVLKLRNLDGDLCKVGDEMLAYLDKTFGSWTIRDNKVAFKKAADGNAYAVLAKKYNGIVEAQRPLLTDLNPPLPTSGASPLPGAPGAGAAPARAGAAPAVGPAGTKP